ncbi:PsbP-related protein [Methanobacterium sp.]|uniref:PsbP-related protein n=1 Tax=Methanobacterium sp. TaxID=2164 RepID=UPI003C74D5F9
MRKYLILVISILALVVFTSGCTDNGNQTKQSTVPTESYAVNGISFNYPDSWVELKNITTQNSIVAYGDPDSIDKPTNRVNTLVIVQKVPMPSGFTLKQFYDDTYAKFAAQDPSFQQISDSTTTVDGTTAYVNTHKIDVGRVQKEEKAVWLEKDGYIYIILMGSIPDAFSNQQANFDAIINSFQVQ